MVDKQRVTTLNRGEILRNGPVVFWMSRDQRTSDNWALLFAAQQANEHKLPLHVVFTLSPTFPGANLRHYSFLIDGLKSLQQKLWEKGIGFTLLMGEPAQSMLEFIGISNASILISDFDPIRIKRQWKKAVNEKLAIPHYEVDAHNIVPCRVASQKAEFGAYTLRPKINRLLNTFLTDFPDLPSINIRSESNSVEWQNVVSWLNPDTSVKPIDWLKSGESNASDYLEGFIKERLNGYSFRRNNPVVDGQSNLSPYLHFGQLSAQRVAIEVSKANAPSEDKAAFLEELIVRRELADNFCFYNDKYDQTAGFHPWALSSHEIHRDDDREYLYSLANFESALTHDPLWNAAQKEMVINGKMHGYMRMYWAKKILEWTASPEQAMGFAIYLNDKYSIDGRDPNGYAGIAWSIGGVHDRAWSQRPVFGKIRYMNYNGCKRKFDVGGYIRKVHEI